MRRFAAAIALIVMTSTTTAVAADRGKVADEATAHRRVLSARAGKIVAALDLEETEHGDPELPQRLQALIAEQYFDLGNYHDAGQSDAGALDALHRRFVARLSAELSPAQVDAVKDGITYGVAPITFDAYVELLPQLTSAQRREIRAQLLEAREYAMDAGSSEAKHAIFGKYKGRINNYLSREGYDLKRAEQQRAARRPAAD